MTDTRPIRIAIIGFGKIAQDQHLPAIVADPRFQLVAVAGGQRAQAPDDIRSFASHRQMIDEMGDGIDAVAICTPPAVRYGIALDCIGAGLHSLLEKPPAATLGEAKDMDRAARAKGLSLFTAWHAQHNEAVATAAEMLADKRLRSVAVEWREDVRKWHPGQAWIWRAGGFGVFDPGINALSIVSRILTAPLLVQEAELVVPSNRQAPIAASLTLACSLVEEPVSVQFDWRHSDAELWTIRLETAEGQCVELINGGAALSVDGQMVADPGEGEYSSIYDRFAELVANRASDVDLEPLRLVADAFLVGRRCPAERFDDGSGR